MKSIMPIIFLSLISTSCAFNMAADMYYLEFYKDTPLYYGDFSEIKTHKDIYTFIHNRVVYKADSFDNKSSPQETLQNGFGDCEDFTLLYLNILYVVFREKGELVLVDSSERKIEEGGCTDHVIVRLPSGFLVEPQTGILVDYTVRYSYSFDDVF